MTNSDWLCSEREEKWTQVCQMFQLRRWLRDMLFMRQGKHSPPPPPQVLCLCSCWLDRFWLPFRLLFCRRALVVSALLLLLVTLPRVFNALIGCFRKEALRQPHTSCFLLCPATIQRHRPPPHHLLYGTRNISVTGLCSIVEESSCYDSPA